MNKNPDKITLEQNQKIEAQRRYEQEFIKKVNDDVYQKLRTSFNIQAMTFFARSDEELEKKVEEWLRDKYVRRLHMPKKKRWWQF